MNTIECHFHGETTVHILLEEDACSVRTWLVPGWPAQITKNKQSYAIQNHLQVKECDPSVWEVTLGLKMVIPTKQDLGNWEWLLFRLCVMLMSGVKCPSSSSTLFFQISPTLQVLSCFSFCHFILFDVHRWWLAPPLECLSPWFWRFVTTTHRWSLGTEKAPNTQSINEWLIAVPISQWSSVVASLRDRVKTHQYEWTKTRGSGPYSFDFTTHVFCNNRDSYRWISNGWFCRLKKISTDSNCCFSQSWLCGVPQRWRSAQCGGESFLQLWLTHDGPQLILISLLKIFDVDLKTLLLSLSSTYLLCW